MPQIMPINMPPSMAGSEFPPGVWAKCDLAEKPLIASGDLTELIAAFKTRPRGNILVPVVRGQRGNPIVLDDAACAQILASNTNLGCRHLIESQPDLVHVHESTNSRFITDLDTLQDVEQLALRTGWRLELPGSEVVA